MTTDDNNFYVTFSNRFSNAVDARTTVRVSENVAEKVNSRSFNLHRD